MSAEIEETENAVLSVMLTTAGKAIDDLAGLTGDDFLEPRRGDLFDAMVAEWASGRPVDAYTLSEKRPGDMVQLHELTSLYAALPSSAGFYADIVRKHAVRRRLAAVGAGFARFDSDLDTEGVAEAARAAVENAIGNTGPKLRTVADILPGLVDKMSDDGVFIPTPWKSLNAKIGGFRPGAVYVIAARPGNGKTVLAGQIAAHMAGHGWVSFSSLEMTDEELVARLVAERLRINVGHIKDARMDVRDWDRLAKGRPALEGLQIAIDDRSGVSVSDVRAFARATSRRGRLVCVIVDYLQLMTSRDRTDRHLQVADFSRRLKILAKDLHVPVVALSQLNRNSEATSLSIPKLSDLRESGAIEQDADVVMLLRREGDFPNEQLVVDVAKNRHGETGDFRLSWDGGYSRAVEWDHTDQP